MNSDSVQLFHGDCLEMMKQIPDGSVDMILCDLPYNVTNRSSEAGGWDVQIPLEPLWEQFLRVTKHNAAIVLFAQGMFTAQLMMSLPKFWRYNLVWDKCRSSGFLNANRMPLRRHEDICVFYRQMPTYNPQKTNAVAGKKTHSRGNVQERDFVKNTCYGRRNEVYVTDHDMKFPGSILRFPKPPPSNTVHPTQKSVDICRWLIRTFTNPGETVLDATAGSGTTAVAAVLEWRKSIAIERDDKYYEIMKRRVDEAWNSPRQMELFA